MSKFIKAAVASSVLAASVMGANAAHAATASANANANILQQITVTNTAPLDFGTIVPSAAAGNVNISAAGVRSCDATVTCLNTTAVSAAAFNVAGTSGQVVDVAADASVTLTSGGNSMNANLTPSLTSMTLAGGDSFTVAGVLAVGANQANGAYTGSFNVTVDYQ